MKIRFIFNPCSGRNHRTPELRPEIQRFITERRLAADLVATERPGHATQLATEALDAGCTHIVAVGGDGTMNEVAQALIGTPAALGLIPCGSGNGLALHLGIPTARAAALALLADPNAHVLAIDTGAANGHAFCNVMGLGFDAEISRRFNRLTRRGLLAYARTGLAAWLRYRPELVTIAEEHRAPTRLVAFLVAVANSDQYGNRARIAPHARVDDGLLDLVAIRPPHLLAAAGLAARLFAGRLDRSRHACCRRAARFVIERAAPGLIHTDGETHATGARIEIVVRPRSLRLVVPPSPRPAH